MRIHSCLGVLGLLIAGACSSAGGDPASSEADALGNHATVRVWITSHPSAPFERKPDLQLGAPVSDPTTLEVLDGPSNQYQEVDGFGAALTDASAAIMHYQLTPKERTALLEELMSPTKGLGLNMLRLPVAASDSTWNGAYSYDEGGPDPSLSRFSVAHDEAYILPMLQEIVEHINPSVHIIASPWSPPAWMKKDTGSMIGGYLPAENRGVYAEYLVKFVRAYWEHHVPIYALTPQNEPGQPADYPSMTMNVPAEQSFLVDDLAPALDKAHFGWVKLLGFDHNWGDAYPDELLSDAKVRSVLSGVAFHCYGGDHESAMTELHDKLVNQWHTNKDLYVTECDRSEKDSGGNRDNTEGIQRLIRAMRNWSRSYIAWQLVLHPDGTPDQGHGCMGSDWHCVGVVSVDEHAPHTVRRQWDFAYLGHASKFVPRGARRVDSGPMGNLQAQTMGPIDNVAFVNPDGTRVLVAYNSSESEQTFQVAWHGVAFTASVPARSAATFTW